MRRLVAVAGALALGVGVAAGWSATLVGTPGPDRLRGTAARDTIDGRAGDDLLEGRGGADVLAGGPGRDTLVGGPGPDRIGAHLDRARDGVRCGFGGDLVNADLADVVAADCEVVARRVSRDPYTTVDGQHETQVEPDSSAFGRTVVLAFQSGRLLGGGANGIGWASSLDAGRTWRAGHLPGLTSAGPRPGPYELVSDPVVAYDAAHRTWLVATLGVSDEEVVLVSRSPDGLRWSTPTAVPRGDERPDKEWLTCDNGTGRFRGRCYLAYMDFESDTLRVRSSTDAGRTWSLPTVVGTGVRVQAVVNGAQPVVRPDGTLVVLVSVFGALDGRENRIVAVRSTDGGVSFGPPVRVASLDEHPILVIRGGALASVDVDRSGRIYATWADCRFREDCDANDVVLATSRDGLAWSAPTRVPTGSILEAADAFVPAVAVTTGPRVAVTYYTLRPVSACTAACLAGIDVSLIESPDGGRTWSAPRRLNAETMRLTWLAESTLGRFLGDYISTSYVGGIPVAVFSLAGPPVAGGFRQAVFAAPVPPAATARNRR